MSREKEFYAWSSVCASSTWNIIAFSEKIVGLSQMKAVPWLFNTWVHVDCGEDVYLDEIA